MARKSRRVKSLDPMGEANYVIGKAQRREACVVTRGPLVYFSTETCDAWMLDPEDGFAVCLARDGARQPFRIMEIDGRHAIEWNAHYEIRDGAFVVYENSGRIRRILGYPTREIQAAIRGSG